MISLEQLNGVAAGQFVEALSGVVEHSPWVAAGAAAQRPFASRLDLLDALRGVVRAAPLEQQLALIRAHPALGAGRTALPLTPASTQEQRRAGLDACTEAELTQLQDLNATYRARLGFPFILAVRGHDPESIIATFEQRLDNPAEIERDTALEQIGLIAGFRLADAVASPAGPEILAMLARLDVPEITPDAAPVRPPALALVREWMLAAGLELAAGRELAVGFEFAGGPALVGIRRGTLPGATRLLLGVHHDPAADALRSEGSLGAVIAIAVVQSLKQTGTTLPFDLVLSAQPPDPGRGVESILTDADAIRGCVAVREGGKQRVLAIVRQSSMGLAYRPELELDAATVDRASRVLEEFIRGSADGSHARTSVWS
jgi:OHCU decarboxylase